MYACGHDTCELCHRRWTVDQGKRSCPVCRAPVGSGAPGEQLPGVCMRLARTVEALFPEVCGVGGKVGPSVFWKGLGAQSPNAGHRLPAAHHQHGYLQAACCPLSLPCAACE